MVTALRSGSLRFVIWPNDHPPPHVHVFSPEAEAKIALGDGRTFPELLENRRMTRSEVMRALRLTFEHRDDLRACWDAIHG